MSAPSIELPADLRAHHDHLVQVLERHLAITRHTPLTGDLIERTLNSFDALAALVEPLRVPAYDLETAEGRLMDAVTRLNQQMPGVALRTLWAVHEYLSTSDDDGVRTRERALRIIQDLGLPEGARAEAEDTWRKLVKLFPPLP